MVMLREDRVSRIDEAIRGDMPTVEKVAGVASDLLNKLADGGMMLSPQDVEKIHTAIGDFTPDALIAAVDKTAHRRGGAVVAEWVVDPSWVGPLEEISKQQGSSLQALIQDMMNTAVANQWFYSITPEPATLRMTAADNEFLKEALGMERFSTADIIHLLKAKIEEADGELFGMTVSK